MIEKKNGYIMTNPPMISTKCATILSARSLVHLIFL